jgi:hypothetical protein
MGNEDFKILCSHLNMIQGHLDYRNTLSEEVRKATLEFFISKTAISPEDFKTLPENVDRRLGMFLYMYHGEFDNYSKFIEKITKVMTIETLCSKDVYPIVSRISNSVYNYTLGKEISLINMTMHLRKKGFNANFHNWNTTYVNVSIPILNDSKSSSASTPESILSGFTESSTESEINDFETDDKVEIDSELMKELISENTLENKKEGKIKVHRFIIYRGGSIKQTSPTSYEVALEVRNVILEALVDFKF